MNNLGMDSARTNLANLKWQRCLLGPLGHQLVKRANVPLECKKRRINCLEFDMVTNMAPELDASWNRYGLIAEIIERFESAKQRLGKTALQKMVFLLQRSFGVDCDYSYTLYTYGPYSADVSRDLDIVEGLDGAHVNYDLKFAGYEIHPGSKSADLRGRASGFLEEIGPKLDKLISDFGSFGAKDLELRSTALYLAKPGVDRALLIQRVHEVKPHFSVAQIETAIAELERKSYILGGDAVSTASN